MLAVLALSPEAHEVHRVNKLLLRDMGKVMFPGLGEKKTEKVLGNTKSQRWKEYKAI